MNLPARSDYINIHDHGAMPAEGQFTVDNIMVHEGRRPVINPGVAFTVGAHPWFLTSDNRLTMMARVREFSVHPGVIAIGESGFDRLKGASPELQKEAFIEHAEIAESLNMPLIIHCVRAYDEVLAMMKSMRPKVPWLLHGFRGKPELVRQLTSKGIFLSVWVEWAIRPVSARSLSAIPEDMLFLETDGFDVGIEPVYRVVAGHLGLEAEKLRERVYQNYLTVFGGA
ncbi:MAG: TatD family hydrolase [Bacteroidales bacterium]|nr:TatD family hydrolase [Bacteroidales bacterium]